MAEITKPIALDESFNTTEGSSRNIADVLAQGIGDLVTVVSRISHQTTYDELSDLEDVNISSPTNGDVLTYDGLKWVNGQGGGGASAEQMIAPVETSTTASQAYAIGEQFILNGTLYTATAAITLGGTIVIDGNCTASDSVTEQINEKPTYTFLASTNLGGWNAKTITDLNEFKYILIIICDGTIDRTSYLVPLSYFKTKNAVTKYIGGYTYVTSNLVIGYGAFYNSDTQIYLNMSNTSYEIKVYGVK